MTVANRVQPDARAGDPAGLGPEPAPDALGPGGDGGADLRARRWHWVRVTVAGGYAVALIGYAWFVRLPTDRRSLAVLVVLALAIRCLGRGWRSYLQIVTDWLPFTFVLMAYDYSRGLADNLGISVHVRAPAAFDTWLGGGTLPSYWLQKHLYTPGVTHWYDAFVTIVYTTHFLAMPAVAAVLWIRNRPAWAGFIRRILAMSVLGLGTYVLYPAAPPWYASEHGVVPPIVRLSSRGWFELRMNNAGNLLAGAQAGSNPVAAMPSLHAATAMIVAFYLMRRTWRWLRPLLALYPIAMGAVLVYAGEHYIVDLLMGYVTAAVVLVGVGFAERRWRRRCGARPASTEAAESGAPVA